MWMEILFNTKRRGSSLVQWQIARQYSNCNSIGSWPFSPSCRRWLTYFIYAKILNWVLSQLLPSWSSVNKRFVVEELKDLFQRVSCVTMWMICYKLFHKEALQREAARREIVIEIDFMPVFWGNHPKWIKETTKMKHFFLQNLVSQMFQKWIKSFLPHNPCRGRRLLLRLHQILHRCNTKTTQKLTTLSWPLLHSKTQ